MLPFEMPEGGLSVVKNLLPADEYYIPMKDKQVYSTNATADTPLHGVSVKDSVIGLYYAMVGTPTKLYRLEQDKSFSDVTKLSTTYDADRWKILQYGNWVVATNYEDAIQVLKGITTTNFVDLSGSPPKAKFMNLRNGHLIVANLYESSADYPERIRWSAKENIEDWTPSRATMADYQDLPYGEIVGLGSVGTDLAIFHQNAISIGRYTGSPWTFSLITDKLKDIRPIPDTMVSYQNACFYWGEKDFYRLDETGNKAIGLGVRNTVLNMLNLPYAHRISAVYDPISNLIAWAFPSTNSEDGEPDWILYFNPRTYKYVLVELPVACMFSMYVNVTGLGYFDSWDSVYPSVDSIPFGLDDKIFTGSTPSFTCMDSTKKVYTFTGTALEGEIQTGEVPFDEVYTVTNIHPRIRNLSEAEVEVTADAKMSENGAITMTATRTINSDGDANMFVSGKVIKLTIKTGQHEGLASVLVEGEKTGDE